MTQSLIDLDDEALAEVARLYGTTTKTDTVNTALRAEAVRAGRLRALDRAAEMGRAGDFDEHLEKRNYRS